MIKMKRVIVLIALAAMVCFMQFGWDVKVNSSMRSSGENNTKEYLNITANRICIIDKEEFARKIIERRVENSYREIYFIERYPDEIEVDVYLNWITWKMKRKAFSIIYEYDGSEGYSFKIEEVRAVNADELIARLQGKQERGEEFTKEDLVLLNLCLLMGGEMPLKDRVEAA